MIINVNGTEKNLSIKQWDGGQYSPDCAADLLAPDVKDGQRMTEQEYSDLVEWIESEIETYNDGGYSEWLGERYYRYYEGDPSSDDYKIKDRDSGEFAVFAD